MKIDVLIKKFVGKECWSVICGNGSGSALHLGFGGKVKRLNVLSNKYLTQDERLYEAEHRIMVYCSWRLSSTESILCSWKDIGGSENINYLNLMRGKKITSADAVAVSRDLCIKFEGGLTLQVFCDETNNEEADDNYVIFSDDMIASVGIKSVLSQGNNE